MIIETGYDRGHSTPAGCMKHSIKAMSESFYLSNISPQLREFYGGNWHSLEERDRHWVYESDSMFVITGPILNESIASIGWNEVTVLGKFYEVV